MNTLIVIIGLAVCCLAVGADDFDKELKLLKSQVLTICDSRQFLAIGAAKVGKTMNAPDQKKQTRRSRREAPDYEIGQQGEDQAQEESDEPVIIPQSHQFTDKELMVNMPNHLRERLQTRARSQQKLYQGEGDGPSYMPPSTRETLNTMQQIYEAPADEQASMAERMATEVPQQRWNSLVKDGMPMLGDGPYARAMQQYTHDDPTYQMGSQMISGGAGSGFGNNLMSSMMHGGMAHAMGNMATMFRPTPGMMIAGAVASGVESIVSATSQVQNIKIMQASRRMRDEIQGLQSATAELANQTQELQVLHERQRQSTDNMDATVGEMINDIEASRLKTNKRLEALGERVIAMTAGTSEKLTGLHNFAQNLRGYVQGFEDAFGESADKAEDKLMAIMNSTAAMGQWTEKAVTRVETTLSQGHQLIELSQKRITNMKEYLLAFSENKLSQSANHISLIDDKISVIDDKLNEVLRLGSAIDKAVEEVIGSLGEATRELESGASQVHQVLSEILTAAKRTKLLATYNAVIARLDKLQKEMDRQVKVDSKTHEFIRSGAAKQWADSVINGDGKGWSMNELLFNLDNLITGKSIVFQKGSILDWYLDAANLLIQKNERPPSERWYIESVTNYLVTLKATGYKLLSAAYLILGEDYKVAETCVAMEKNMLAMDKVFALYIAAASPKFRLPAVSAARVSPIMAGSKAGLAQLTFNATRRLAKGDSINSTLTSCHLCYRCGGVLPSNVLSLQCNFMSFAREELEVPSVDRHQNLIEYGAFSPFSKNDRDAPVVKFVAGMLRLVRPETTYICGVFFAQRMESNALSLGVHVCDRTNGKLLATDNGENERNPIRQYILRDGTEEDGSENERIEYADHISSSWIGGTNTDIISEIGLMRVDRKESGKPLQRILALQMSSNS